MHLPSFWSLHPCISFWTQPTQVTRGCRVWVDNSMVTPPHNTAFCYPSPSASFTPSPCLSSCPFSDSVRPNWRSGVPGKEKHPLTNTDRNVAAAATMVKSQLGLKISLITGFILFFCNRGDINNDKEIFSKVFHKLTLKKKKNFLLTAFI